MLHLISLLFVLFALFYINLSDNNSQSLSVQTTSGKILGKIVQENGNNYNVFMAIPFAQPPVGKLRFKPPVSIENPDKTIDGTGGFSKQCIQTLFNPNGTNESEDCLYLNVMTPNPANFGEAKYPVMVWIHGGGFSIGSASQYAVNGILKNLVSKGVIVVTINYRLGVFGFFTTKSSVAPGNYGMLDQVEALRWVKKNIRAFGGDPSKVTIFGESAGGASVSLLTISPLAKGLYSGAIPMSGSALASYATMPDDSPLDFSRDLLRSLNCTSDSSVNQFPNQDAAPVMPILKCPFAAHYKHQPKNDTTEDEKLLACILTKSVKEIATANKMPFGWSIRVDGNFLTEAPETAVKQRTNNNLMIGVTRDEAALFGLFEMDFAGHKTTPVLSKEAFYKDTIFSNFYILCKHHKYPALVNFTSRYHYANVDLGKRVEGFSEQEVWFQRYSDIQSAPVFWIPSYVDAVEAAKTQNNVYAYSWDWLDAMEFYRNDSDFYYKGAVHGSELLYLFGMDDKAMRPLLGMMPFPEARSKRDKSKDEDAKRLMSTLWTNFAKFGNPTPEETVGVVWQKFDVKSQNYLSINFPTSRMENGFYSKDAEFWTNFVPQLENSVDC